MSTSLIVTLCVLIFVVLFAVIGYRKGLLKMLVAVLSVVLTIVVAALVTPYFSDLLEKTFIGTNIEKSVSEYVEKNIGDPLIEKNKQMQTDVIDKLPIPKFLKTDYETENTATGYIEEKVTTFEEYLTSRLTGTIVTVIAFIILLILVQLILRIIFAVLKLFTKIPIIKGMNQTFGAIIGIVEALLIIWGLCLIVMAISQTPLGIKITTLIEGNFFLKFIYDNNMILTLANYVFGMF